MRNKTKIGLILFLMATAAVTLFAGCIGEMGAEEFLKDKDAYEQLVTYYANGGYFDGTKSITEKTIHYTPDSYVVGDFEDVQNISVAKADNEFGGWYYAELDNENKPVKDNDGNVVVTDRAVDFSVTIKRGEHWYICADWIPNVKVDVVLVTDDGGDVHDRNNKTYKNGEIMFSLNFQQGFAIIETTEPTIKVTDYTFTQYFYDEECTQRVLGNIPMPEGEKPANPVIYVKYIKGSWNVVRDYKGVRQMLLGLNSGNYYFSNMSEDKTIDCSAMTPVALRQNEVGARIEGNGFTIKNLSYNVVNTAVQVGGTYSLFGSFGSECIVRGLTFDGVTITATMAREVSLYAISAGGADGAVIEDVAFKNVRLSITTNTNVTKIGKDGDDYNVGNWLLGGAGSTDAAFLERFKGLTVESGKLIMTYNGETKEYDYPVV